MTYCVYRVYDAADRLLYVGSSNDVNTRMTAHEKSAVWWPYVERFAVQMFPNEESAREAESLAIATEHPRWNVRDRSHDHPDGHASAIDRMPWLDYERELSREIRSLMAATHQLRAKYRQAAMELRAKRSLARSVSDGTFDLSDPIDDL